MEAVGARVVNPARWQLALRRVHAATAGVVGTFTVVHLANHLAALGGVQMHIAFMHAARHVYRQPALEVLLLSCVALQISSGLAMVCMRAWPRGGLPRVQAIAGIVIAAFLFMHVAAILAARALFGLDTTFHFAAAGLHAGAWTWFFVPYYGGAVLALFVHVGCALQRRAGLGAPRWGRVAIAAALGVPVALVIVLCLAGVLIGVAIPAAYRAPYGLGTG